MIWQKLTNWSSALAVRLTTGGRGIRCLVADVTGTLIAELTVEVGPVSWRLNQAGRAEFSIARSDDKAIRRNLKPGNRVLFQFENGLPDWGGVIDPPIEWSADGRIQCAAYSGEYLLGLRRTAKDRQFDGDTVGAIFERLILDANGTAATGITLGSVWTGGDVFSLEYHYDDLLQVVEDLLTERLAADFCVTAAEVDGTIAFTANFYEKRGSSKSGVALIEGHNFQVDTYAEEGPIYNVVYTPGGGSTWGDERVIGEASNAASVSTYGRREYAEAFSDVTQQTALDGIAQALVDEHKDPHVVVSGSALNVRPALFASYGVGDSVRLWLHNYGFDGYDHSVRVLAREYTPATGQCALVVEEDD